jgi:hypothetical protein
VTRSRGKDRLRIPNAVRLECPECRKLLDLADEQVYGSGMVDNFGGGLQWVTLTNAAGETLSWWRSRCPRCGFVSKARPESDLLELVRSAQGQGLDRVTVS